MESGAKRPRISIDGKPKIRRRLRLAAVQQSEAATRGMTDQKIGARAKGDLDAVDNGLRRPPSL